MEQTESHQTTYKRHVTISMDAELHAKAVEHARKCNMSFSEMVARLSNAEINSKSGIARRFADRFTKAA